jgi:hypothetical protein
MVNIGYRLARWQGNWQRKMYSSSLNEIVHKPISISRKISASVYSFSCERDLPEQVASIRSFLSNVGKPEEFIIISDGTYTSKSIKLLSQIDDCIKVVDFRDILKSNLPKFILDFTDQHPLGKKFAALISLPINRPTFYTDSDILFFPGANEIVSLIEPSNVKAWYTLDCMPSLDERLIQNCNEMILPVNSGFLLVKEPLDWDIALERLASFQGLPTHHTEQTLIHLVMHENSAFPLCHSKCIISVSDQFIYQNLYEKKNIILRHYVNNIRHKFWLAEMLNQTEVGI